MFKSAHQKRLHIRFKYLNFAGALGLCAALLGGTGAVLAPTAAQAYDLGIEGQVYEPIEEDFRLALLRLLARQDWTTHLRTIEKSAKEYTKNLPDFFIPLAQETKTLWRDVGVVVEEDIYVPSVDWEHGSVFEPGQVLALEAGVYLNPIAQLPSVAIERLFVFDATSPEQLAFAKELMSKNIPLLNFMIVAGDLGPISKEMQIPVYHLTSDMLEKFQISAVPSLIGFGRGPHLGHMATTQFKWPMTAEDITLAWFGLPYPGYDPHNVVETEVSAEEAAKIRAIFTQAADAHKRELGQGVAPSP